MDSEPLISLTPLRQCLPGELPGAGPPRYLRQIVQADVLPLVALEREREYRIRPDVHGVVDVPGQVHAEERVTRVGHRVDHAADAVSRLRPQLVVLTAERDDAQVTGPAEARGEVVAAESGADDQVVEVPAPPRPSSPARRTESP